MHICTCELYPSSTIIMHKGLKHHTGLIKKLLQQEEDPPTEEEGKKRKKMMCKLIKLKSMENNT